MSTPPPAEPPAEDPTESPAEPPAEEPAEPLIESPTEPLDEDPHVGSEDDPAREADPHDETAVVPPRRYEPAPSGKGGDVDRPRREPTAMDRLIAASGPLALVTFFLIGFGTGRWYIAWVVFLVPGILRAWNRP